MTILTFLVLQVMFLCFFFIVGRIIAFCILFLIFTGIQVIPNFRFGLMADELFVLLIVLTSAVFHNISFMKNGRKTIPDMHFMAINPKDGLMRLIFTSFTR